MKHLRRFLLPVLPAVILLLAVRGLLVSHMHLSPDNRLKGYEGNGHVLVSLTYYGLRVPGEALWGYQRWGYRVPAKGEVLVFNLPIIAGKAARPTAPIASGALSAGICRALPGDTLWLDPVQRELQPVRTAPEAQPLVVPGRQHAVRVTPSNVRLLAYILTQYEHAEASVDASGHLVLRGARVNAVRLARDYYWVATNPKVSLLVPHDALLGKVVWGLKPAKQPAKKDAKPAKAS